MRNDDQARERVAYRGDDAILAPARDRRRLVGASLVERHRRIRNFTAARLADEVAQVELEAHLVRSEMSASSSSAVVAQVAFSAAVSSWAASTGAMIARPRRTRRAVPRSTPSRLERSPRPAGSRRVPARRRGSPSPRPQRNSDGDPGRGAGREPERDEAASQRHTAGDGGGRDASRVPTAATIAPSGSPLTMIAPVSGSQPHTTTRRSTARKKRADPARRTAGGSRHSPARSARRWRRGRISTAGHDHRPPRRSATPRVAPAAGRCCAS